ncbi:Sodium-dependent dicarboxylate transporter SdcS [Lacunisphaera limnophila]|uniref:Sodium-dependent dicarboxylate transporter SdcS n=1 Tax=Lacunisphaera limnophila TaxID=1838286 RepID=A0A1D8AZN3_9BACT|nr:DASS family sodium-coupled anion symporter [Lacunisphaera limnophila]AOS46335.1 Sodium-dependent dicarboxylate transporter SdcS [Lacunisphaera limnophila]
MIARLEARFERWRRPVGLALAPAAALVVWWLPLPGLAVPAHKLAALMTLAIILWVSEAIPMAATSLLVPALCIVFGVGAVPAVLAPFASSITFLFIGSFLLGLALQKHGLDRRLALRLLSLPGVTHSAFTVMAALGVLTALLSMWMSNTGTTAVMLPLALGVMQTCPELGRDLRARENLILLIAFAASVGGLATPVGTPPNLIALAALREHAGISLTFVQWMQLALPLSLLMLAWLLWLLRPPAGINLGRADDLRRRFRDQLAALGPWRRGEIHVAGALAAAIFLWVFPGMSELLGFGGNPLTGWIRRHFPEDIIGLLAGLLLLVWPTDFKRWTFTLEWHEAVKIDWGTILLFAGGLSLGAQIFQTGLARAIGEGVGALLGQPDLWTLVAVAIILSIALSEAASNTASAAIMAPMMIAVALAAGVNPIPVALACTLACSFGFLLPVSTGPNAQAYATQQVRLLTMMRQGLWLDLVGAVVIWLVVRFLAPLYGWT